MAGQPLLTRQHEGRQLRGKKLKLVATCTLAEPVTLESRVLPLRYTLVASKRRPRIRVAHRHTEQQWLV